MALNDYKDYKKFNGKVYVKIATFKYKYGADLYAKALRRDGWLVRILKSVKTYHIYRGLYNK